MARYLFNMIDGDVASSPLEKDLPDFEAVRGEALRTACLIINEQGDRFWKSKEWQMVVTDGGGLILFTLHFHATVAPVALGHFAGNEA